MYFDATSCQQPHFSENFFHSLGVVNDAARLENELALLYRHHVLRRSISSPEAIMSFVGETLTASVRMPGDLHDQQAFSAKIGQNALTKPKSKPERRKVYAKLARIVLALRVKVRVQVVASTVITSIRTVRIQRNQSLEFNK